MSSTTASEPTPEHLPLSAATTKLRQKIREYARQQREQQRAKATDSLRFGLGEIKSQVEELEHLKPSDVTGMATRIKRRKHATIEDMYRLSHAFLQDIDNIRTFANIAGAIQVLVKELTGQDAERQIGASECICNLSLGEGYVCEKIVLLAGSYIVTYLNSTAYALKRTSLWTIANIIVTGGKGAQTLLQMELVPMLWRIYLAPDQGTCASPLSTDFADDAGICLQLLAFDANTLLREEDRHFIRTYCIKKNPTCPAGEYHLQILFACQVVDKENSLSEAQELYLVNYALSNLAQAVDFDNRADRLRIVYAVRMLGNMMASQPRALSVVLQQLAGVWQTSLVAMLNKLFAFRNASLTRETMWLLQNALQQSEQTNKLIDHSILDQLNIYCDRVAP